jgi:hypothetical protein
MFKRHKPKATTLTDATTETMALRSDSVIQHRINKIQSLVGVTQNDFLKIYIKTLEHFIEYTLKSTLSSEEATHQLSVKLDDVILALQKRQGYLLPLGADSEQVFREQEVWTFAIFTAALFVDMSQKARLEVAKSLIPLHPYHWLKRHAHVFESWNRYLSSDLSTTLFHEIIQNKITIGSTISPLSVKNDNLSHSSNIEPVTNIDQLSTEHQLTTLELKSEKVPLSTANYPITSEIKEKEKTQGQTKNNSIIDEKCNSINISKITTPKQIEVTSPDIITEIDLNQLRKEQEAKLKPSPNKANSLDLESSTIGNLNAEDFLDWITHIINQNPEETSKHGVYCVTLGILIALPTAIDQFINQLVKSKHSYSQQPVIPLKSRILLTKAIKKQPLLIRNAQGSRIHTYYQGSWGKRQVISGVIFSIPSLLGETIALPLDASLSPDPISTI